jgi:hypothetical protein
MGSLSWLDSIWSVVRFNIGDRLGEIATFLSGFVCDFVELGGAVDSIQCVASGDLDETAGFLSGFVGDFMELGGADS